MGPSGSGKSSLVAILAGQVAPTAGRVELAGRVARIHQDLRLVPRASALRNVLHGCLGRVSFGQSLRFPASERQRAEALLRRVGLGHRLHAPVRTLSGGEAQRVAIARALMQDPDILLADEPVASLDPANAAAIMALLDELRRERGLTLVSVLHDVALAERHADTIVRLQQGSVVPPDGDWSATAAAPAAPATRGPERLPPNLTFLALSVVAVALSWGVVANAPGTLDGAFGEAVRFLARLVPTAAQWAEIPWGELVGSLLDTLRMAVLGTLLATVFALPLSALAAKNIVPAFVGWPV
ncbi:MAG: ATP-binding cassette domain-containing protein, partial [Sphingomonadaceae bacterium]